MVGASRHAGDQGVDSLAETLENARRHDAQGAQPAPDSERPGTEGRACSLTWAGLLLRGGSLGDSYGRRRLSIFGILWFAAASLI
jgi:hypothetical protein